MSWSLSNGGQVRPTSSLHRFPHRIILQSLQSLIIRQPRAGISHLQECSQPKAHIESDDDEFAENEETKQQQPKEKPQRRLHFSEYL